jgi:hypothetical protein
MESDGRGPTSCARHPQTELYFDTLSMPSSVRGARARAAVSSAPEKESATRRQRAGRPGRPWAALDPAFWYTRAPPAARLVTALVTAPRSESRRRGPRGRTRATAPAFDTRFPTTSAGPVGQPLTVSRCRRPPECGLTGRSS